MRGELAQVEDHVARREGVARRIRRAGDVALAALRAGVERDEVLPGEIRDLPVPNLFRRRALRKGRQPLAREVVADADVRWAREHVHRLRERDRGDERERDDAVRPPGGEMGARRLLGGHAEPAEAAPDGPADRRPGLEGRIRLRDAERLEQEAAQREEEERPEEDPVADHVDASVLLAVRAVVVQAVSAIAGPFNDRRGQVGLESLRYRHWAGPWSAAAVGGRKRLVQVQVHDVHAKRPRSRDAHERVHIGAVHVDQPTLRVHNPADLADLGLEDA